MFVSAYLRLEGPSGASRGSDGEGRGGVKTIHLVDMPVVPCFLFTISYIMSWNKCVLCYIWSVSAPQHITLRKPWDLLFFHSTAVCFSAYGKKKQNSVLRQLETCPALPFSCVTCLAKNNVYWHGESLWHVCDRRCRTQNWCQAPPRNKDLRPSHSAPHMDPLRAHSLMTCHVALYHVSSCLTEPHDALWLVGRSSCPCGGSPQRSGWCVCDCNQNSSSTKAGFLKDTLRSLSFFFCAHLVGWSWLLWFGRHCWQYHVLFKPIAWLFQLLFLNFLYFLQHPR